MKRENAAEEIEIKLRIPEGALDLLRAKLAENGFRETAPRGLEDNVLFDGPDRRLVRAGSALRLRLYDGRSVLTWKGPVKPDRDLKIREEIETTVSDRDGTIAILNRLGLCPVLSYRKYREKYRAALAGPVEVCLDETRIGWFIEIEGSEDDIAATLAGLGLDRSEAVKATYVELLGEPVEEGSGQ